MYAVTLPGFGGTAAPPCPPAGTSFGEQTWTNSALTAIEKLMKEERIENAVVVGHWLGGTQLALRLALAHPDRITAVVLLAGSARLSFTDTTYAAYYATPEKRIATTDHFMAARWFKTVTRETWDDNNFLPSDYAAHPVCGLRLWRQAASPGLHTWVRYLCEFNAQDVTVGLDRLKVRTLLLRPGLENAPHDPGQNYMQNYCHLSWQGAIEKNASITAKTIPNSRVCMWFDQPEGVKAEVTGFLARRE
jgi:pimeloyl-ACP methyl ester carboxylesterase